MTAKIEFPENYISINPAQQPLYWDETLKKYTNYHPDDKITVVEKIKNENILDT